MQNHRDQIIERSKNFDNMKTLDEILEHGSIKNITKFIKKRELYKYEKLGYIPCYNIGNKKGYKVNEVAKWIKDQLIVAYNGSNILTKFNVTVNTSKKPISIPHELTNHNGDLYEYSIIPSCVYFLIDAGQIVYVGQSTNLASRLIQHRNNKEFNRILYMPIENNRLDEVERFFIETLEPKYNAEQFIANKSYRYKGLGYKLINKVLYREKSNGVLDKIL